MPITKVRSPDGRIIRVRHPEGASQEEIIAYAKKQRQPIDVLARRKEAVGEFLTPIEKLGGGVRDTTARIASRINEPIYNLIEAGTGQEAVPFLGPRAAEVERNILEMSPGGWEEAVGEILPILATGRLTPQGAGPLALLGSSAAGAGTGYLTASDAETGAAIGGAAGPLGNILGGSLGRLGTSLRGKFAERAVRGADDTAEAIRGFQDLGGRLTPGQASGGRVAQMIDNALTSFPVTAGPYRKLAAQNRQLITRLAARAAGVNADSLGPTALRQIDDSISDTFNAVADQIDNVPVPSSMLDDVAGLLSKRRVQPFEDAIRKGNLSGKEYMKLRSQVLALTRRRGSDKVDDAWDLIDELDNYADKVMPEGAKRAYAAARERYKTVLAFDRYRRGISGGEANAPTLEGAVRNVFGKQYTRDLDTVLPETKDLFTALRAMSDPRMATHLGGSPTAERLAPWLLGGGMFYDPTQSLAAVLAGAHLGARGMLAAPTPLASQAGGTAARALPNVLSGN